MKKEQIEKASYCPAYRETTILITASPLLFWTPHWPGAGLLPAPGENLVVMQPAVQAYLGRAKAACLCSCCCNRHLCYDGGRLGRVKIVTLRVGARAKEGKRGGRGEKKNTPFSPLPRSF